MEYHLAVNNVCFDIDRKPYLEVRLFWEMLIKDMKDKKHGGS